MHSSVIGKIEKANRYSHELDRITIDQVSLTFRGDNDTHVVTLDADRWHCNCHSFESWAYCAHVLAMQKILGSMLAESAQTGYFGAPEPQLAEVAPA